MVATLDTLFANVGVEAVVLAGFALDQRAWEFGYSSEETSARVAALTCMLRTNMFT